MANRSLNRREFMKVGAVGMIGSTFSLNNLKEVDTTALKASLPTEILQQLEDGTLTCVSVQQVLCDQPNNIPVVQLHDEEARQLHIYVGVTEGNAIRMALEEQTTPRPMTHDMMRNLIEVSGMQVECAVITQLQQTTFYALLLMRIEGELKAVDSRPSDAIALCLRVGAPIYANRTLLTN